MTVQWYVSLRRSLFVENPVLISCQLKLLSNTFNVPFTAVPVTVGDAHHDKAGDKEEENEAGGSVDDGGGCRDRNRCF